MTRQERVESDQDARYPGMRFFDHHGRFIKIKERMPLRTAIRELEDAQRAYREAQRVEAMTCGAENYARAQAVTRAAYRTKAEAHANAQAAFYRATGRWPHTLFDLGLR